MNLNCRFNRENPKFYRPSFDHLPFFSLFQTLFQKSGGGEGELCNTDRYLRFATPRLSALYYFFFCRGRDQIMASSERKSITLSDKKLLLPAIRISSPTFIPCLLFRIRSIRFEKHKLGQSLANFVSFILAIINRKKARKESRGRKIMVAKTVSSRPL